MFLAPLIERELRNATRTNKGMVSRFRVALTGAFLVVVISCIGALAGSAEWGRALHKWCFWGGLYLAVVPAMRISIGLFSEERRNQTLELLYLTGMKPSQLFVGKLLGGTLIASADLLALAPLLAVPFLMGGISLNLYLATVVCLPALLLFALAVGVLASVLFEDEGAAFIFLGLFAALVNLAAPIPYYLGKVLDGRAPFSGKWLCLSPAYAPYLVSINFGSVGLWAYWMTALAIFAWTGLCLAFACLFLSRNWRNEVQGAARTRWRGWFDGWVRGSRSWRAALRDRLLPEHPFNWLVQQDRRPGLVGYGAIGLISLLWLIGWRAWPQAWPSNPNFFITAMVLIVMVNQLTLFAAARRMGADRRDGILELLLTTPLPPQEIVDGEVAGLAAEFKPLRRTALTLFIFMMLGGFMLHSWNARSAITCVLIWGVLFASCLKTPKARILEVMWAALNTGRPAYSVFRRRGSRWTWFWMFYNVRALVRNGFGGGTAAFPSGSKMEFVIVCVVGIPACALYYLTRALRTDHELGIRRRLVTNMRLIATEPLPDQNDPSYKSWDAADWQQYRGGSTKGGLGWPVFADPVATDRPQPSRGAPSREASKFGETPPQDALDLFNLLREQAVDYLMAGQLAINAYLADRHSKNADVLMPASALKGGPELEIREQTNFFCCARFRGIRVRIFLTANPFFEAVQRQCATTLRVGGMEVPAATVEGLIAMNLYALHLLSRQRDYYRADPYEEDIIALLARHQTATESILSVVRTYVAKENLEELENTLENCVKAARTRGKRSRGLRAFYLLFLK
jgi:ABC-type Na+ efflux pump permease subunit